MNNAAQRPWRAHERGMTLIEVIVALAVLSLVMLALGASLRGMSMSAQRIDERVDAIDEMRVTNAFLHEVLDRVSMVRVPGPERRLLFEASDNSVAWVAVMPARFGAAGRYAFRLTLEPVDDGARALVLRYAPWVGESSAFADWAQAEHRVLVKHAERLVLGYGGDGMAQGWLPVWPERDKLPPRLRIDLATTAGPWPPLVLPMRTPPLATGRFTVGGDGR